MKKKYLILTSLIYLFIISSYSFSVYDENSKNDTLVKKEFPVITVEGKKKTTDNVLKYTNASIITKNDINIINPSTLSDVIKYQPGVYIRDYGGLGGLKSISLRGTNSMQTLITFEGMRLNSSQTSMLDLNKVPISIIEEIHVYKGGSSSFSGSNSIAGVINLETLKNIKKDRLSVNFDYGSFNEIKATANLSFAGINQFAGHLEYHHSDGNFPFYSNQFGELKEFKRENGNYDRFSIYIFRPTGYKSFSTKPFILFSLSRRGSPGAVLQGHIESLEARLNESMVLFNIPTDLTLSKSSSLKSNLSFKFDNTDYYNPELTFLKSDKIKFNNNEVQFSSIFTKNFLNVLNFSLGLDLIASELMGNMLEKEAGDTVKRLNIASFSNLDYEWVSTENFHFSTNIALRADAVSKLFPNYSYSFGATANLFNSRLIVKTLLSNNFRIPSFNEMYYLNYGNSNLKTEKSINLNFGLIYNISESLNLELNSFLIRTNDQIVSIPLSPLRWSAKNIEETFSRGFEFSSNLMFFNDLLNIKFNYTFQKVTDETPESYTNGKILVYTPQELINSSIFIKTGIANVLLQFFYSSHRFYMPDNSYNAYLPSYFLVNFSIFKNLLLFNNSFHLRIDIDNLLDRRYEIIRNYPMPGLSIKVGLGLNLNLEDNKYD